MATGLRQREEVNKVSSFLLRYQPSAISALPIISPIAHDVLSKNNGRCSKTELTIAFETDPFLSARLLGEANSTVFNRCHHTVYTVRQALETVGMEYAFRVLHAAPTFSLNSTSTKKRLSELWIRWITIAHATRELSTYASVAMPPKDAMFVIGLIHDIGHLLEMYYDPERLGYVAQSGGNPESDNGTTLHTTLGESLAKAWALPDCMVQAIRWHHHPDQCPTQNGRALAALVFLAGRVSSCYLAELSIPVELCTTALAIAGLKEKHMHIVFETMKQATYFPTLPINQQHTKM